MKKILSLVLAVVLVVGLSSVAFGAATGRIKGAIKPIDTNSATPNLDEIKADFEYLFPLTADMFEWSGTPGAANEPVTRAQISAAGVKTELTGSGTNAIASHSIVYEKAAATGNVETAHVKIKFAKNNESTSDLKFNLNLFLRTGSRQGESRIPLVGSIVNTPKTVSDGDYYVDISKGETLTAESFIRNLEIYIGNDVTIRTNVFQNQKYYGTTTNSPKPEDDKVLTKYNDITDIIYLSTINLNKAGSNVTLDFQNGFVYNSKGVYLGPTSKAVAYSVKYYISAKNLGTSIDVTGAGTGTGTDPGTDPGTTTPITPVDPVTPPVTGDIIGKATAVSNTQDAIKKTTTKVALVTYKNYGGITAEALQAMASTGKASNKTVQVNADTTGGGTVVGRLTINPALASKLTANTKFGVFIDSVKTQAVSAHFNKWFKNNMAFVSLEQKGSFGMNVNVAVKVNLSGLNTKNLRLYSFNASTNQFAQITNANIWVDANGYLRFTTSAAGEIVVSDGALAKK